MQDVCRRLRDDGHAAYVVGGALRDIALGRAAAADWDVATAARPERVLALFRRAVPTGLAHGTVTVIAGGRPVEVTTFRGDGAYQDGRHPVAVTFVPDVREDLARRDFTVNAMAGDPLTGELVDPFDGAKDLAARILRAVGDPDARFSEDGLRPMRAARFAATLEFDVEPATRAALGRHRDVFRMVSRERVRDELSKLLLAPRPSVGLRLLHESGLLAEFLAPLAQAHGVPQNRFHEFDLLEHTLRTVDGTPPRLPVRLAALLHDLGKLEAAAWNEQKGDRTFVGHERISAAIAEALLRELRYATRECEHVVALVANHGTYYDASWTDAAVRRWIRRVGADRIDDQLGLLAADLAAKGDRPDVPSSLDDARTLGARAAALLAARPALDENALAIDGGTIMTLLGIGPGPRIGEIKRALLELVTDDPSRNTPDDLSRVVRERWGGGRPQDH
ncbi:MAG: HD domain-containing protein [Deltaproteobacteria bacterium]|nr:HD domain-containing protein [Deltaproteobacteria bacterium]